MHEEKPENPTPLNTESFFDRFNLAKKKKIMLVYSPCSVIGDFIWKQNVKRQLWHKTIKAHSDSLPLSTLSEISKSERLCRQSCAQK